MFLSYITFHISPISCYLRHTSFQIYLLCTSFPDSQIICYPSYEVKWCKADFLRRTCGNKFAPEVWLIVLEMMNYEGKSDAKYSIELEFWRDLNCYFSDWSHCSTSPRREKINLEVNQSSRINQQIYPRKIEGLQYDFRLNCALKVFIFAHFRFEVYSI